MNNSSTLETGYLRWSRVIGALTIAAALLLAATMHTWAAPRAAPGQAHTYAATAQNPQTPDIHGQPGKLELEKTVKSASDPATAGDIVTYTIRLKHVGGTGPAITSLSDALPAGVQLVGPLRIVADTPQVSPLLVRVDHGVISWRGGISPGGVLRLSIPVKVRGCFGNDPQAVKNVVHARQTDSSSISAEAVIHVQCTSISIKDVEVTQHLVWNRPDPSGNGKSDQEQDDRSPATLIPGVQAFVRADFTNHGGQSVVVGFNFMKITWEPAAPATTSDFGRGDDFHGNLVELKPGETQSIYRSLASLPGWDLNRTAEDPNLDLDVMAAVNLRYCLVFSREQPICPPPNNAQGIPVAQANPLHINWAYSDLGDAPDSTNHDTAPMTAYPAVPAKFPTVFDPATGSPQGPKHLHTRPFHLGQLASWEAEADLGPDQDLTNNLIPKLDKANLDRADDGVNPPTWTLQNCQTTKVPVQIFIDPVAVAYFQKHQSKGYLNIWIDSLRNGNWADAVECPSSNGQKTYAVEHVVIDYPVDAVALGAGLHTIQAPTGLVPWPAALAEKPAWVRVTLSEQPSNKTLTDPAGTKYGDGRGYAKPFVLGETEDYLWHPANNPGGIDVAVRKAGRVEQNFDIESGKVTSRIAWTIEYRNNGDQTAHDVQIRDHLSPGQNIIGVLIALLMPQVSHHSEGNELVFDVGAIPPGGKGRIVLATRVTQEIQQMRTITNVVTVRAPDDVDASNNSATATVEVGVRAPNIITPANGTTCDGMITVKGRAEANASVDLYVDNTLTATVTADAHGLWQHDLTLTDGSHTLYAIAKVGSITSPQSDVVTVIVDSTLSWNPLSLTFTDRRGRIRRPVDENGRMDADGWSVRLHPNTAYTVSVQICCQAKTVTATLVISARGAVTLTHSGDDPLYTGVLTTGPRNPASTTMTLTVICSDTVVSDGGSVVLIDPEGQVNDIRTGQPLGEASVANLEANTGAANAQETTAYSLWDGSPYGQINPQTTQNDGQFSFLTPPGAYQLSVNRTGYQAYRSPDLVVVQDPVHYDVGLTPAIQEAAAYTINISTAGFDPMILTVPPGAVVAWVNTDAADHTATSSGAGAATSGATAAAWDSGLLSAGQVYKFRMDTEGSYTYVDQTNPANTATIIVSKETGTPGENQQSIFLPVIQK